MTIASFIEQNYCNLTRFRLTFTRSKGDYSSSLSGPREVTRGENQADDCTVIVGEFLCVCVCVCVRVCVSVCVTASFSPISATSVSLLSFEIIKTTCQRRGQVRLLRQSRCGDVTRSALHCRPKQQHWRRKPFTDMLLLIWV